MTGGAIMSRQSSSPVATSRECACTPYLTVGVSCAPDGLAERLAGLALEELWSRQWQCTSASSACRVRRDRIADGGQTAPENVMRPDPRIADHASLCRGRAGGRERRPGPGAIAPGQNSAPRQ